MAELKERGTYDPDADNRPVRHSLNSDHDRAAGKVSDPRGENTAAGDSSDPRGQGLDNVRSGESLFNKNGDGDASSTATSGSSSLLEKEQGSTSSGMFNPAGDSKTGAAGKFRSLLKRRRKAIALGGGATGGVVAIGILLATLLIPLKIEHMVTNLQDKFFASSEQASGDAIEKMTYRYFKKNVLPAYKNCGSTISKDCKVKITGSSSNPVTQLYKSWSDVKLEHTFATKYNIEFQFNKRSNSWFLKGPGAGENGINIGENGERLDSELKKNNRSEVRQAVKQATQGETLWKRIMYRYKIGRLLESKYNLKRCMVYCSKRDQFADKVDQKKNAAKILLAQRVITPRNTAVGAVMQCLMDPNCHPEKTTSDSTSPGGSGEPESDFERDNRTSLKDIAAKYGSTNPEDVDKMIADYKAISDKGYGKFVLAKVLDKIGIGGEFSDKLAERASVVGWVNTASTAIGALSQAGPKVKKLSYVANSAAAVSLYMSYRTYADEIHTGKIDSTEVGSFTESLSPGNRGGVNDEEIGGTAGAESSPIYKQLMDGDSNGTSVSLIKNVFSTKTYADSTNTNQYSTDYKCNEDKPLVDSVCPEEKLGGGNATADNVSTAFHTPPLSYLTTAANAWNSTGGKILGVIGDIFGSALSAIPGVSNLTDFIAKAIQPFYTYITKQLIPDPFGSNMSGARNFNMMAAGANVAGNDACTQIGCKTATSQQAMAIANRQQTEAKSEFQSQPFMARMFSTTSQYSFVSKVAMDVPLNTYSSLLTNITAVLRNPTKVLSNSFASIFSTDRAFAATSTGVDPFGVGGSAFPDEEIPDDPEEYWETHNCADTSDDGPIAQWQKAAASPDGNGPVNPNTGMPMHTTVEPCLLIKNAVGDAGAKYDTDLLSDDEKAALNGVGGSSSAAEGEESSNTSAVDGDAKELAKQLIDSGKITGDSRYMGQINAVARGDYSCNINPDILKMLVGVTKDGHKLFISSLNRKCTGVLTASGSASFHYSDGGGHAVDITSYDGKTVNGGNAATLSFLKEAEKYLPDGSGLGQVGCGSGYTNSKKFGYFSDSCNHQHIQVPKKQAK